eukprot:gnl/MRDRNA2_/MRDRNA2_49927_c0_seq1.p1 gnl/MRDRNA2_/MRDRNA2_49927_c0~~gnl/MRDRNA2_/MRDRNA2_49927_c0_seq1.p1  ORF type:complete len:142 (-),score=17.58 gnl/MRDRNA2_/MRDRNA2_49927_c0_seq1:363-767(-)
MEAPPGSSKAVFRRRALARNLTLSYYVGHYQDFIEYSEFEPPTLVIMFHPGFDWVLDSWRPALEYWASTRVPVVVTCLTDPIKKQDDIATAPGMLKELGFDIVFTMVSNPFASRSGRNLSWLACRSQKSLESPM